MTITTTTTTTPHQRPYQMWGGGLSCLVSDADFRLNTPGICPGKNEWDIAELVSEKVDDLLSEFAAEMCLVFRQRKVSPRGEEIAVLMMCAPSSERKYVLRFFDDDELKRQIMVNILVGSRKIHCADSKTAKSALLSTFRLAEPKVTHTKKDVAYSTLFPKVASELGMRYCRAHQESPFGFEDDLSESVMWHLGLELEFLRKTVGR